MSRNLDQISVISIGSNSHFYLNIWKNNLRPIKLKIARVCADLKAALSIESSADDQLLFLGGNSNLESQKSEALISVIDVSDLNNVREIRSFVLEHQEMVTCLRLKRVDTLENRELLLVSGRQHVVLLEYRKELRDFEVLKRYPNLQNGEIFDFSIHDGSIVTCSPADNFLHKC